MHVLAPAEVLAADPLPGAVAQVALREAAGAGPAGPALPQGTERFAVVVDGTESEEELASLQVAHLVPARVDGACAVEICMAQTRGRRVDVELCAVRLKQRWSFKMHVLAEI